MLEHPESLGSDLERSEVNIDDMIVIEQREASEKADLLKKSGIDFPSKPGDAEIDKDAKETLIANLHPEIQRMIKEDGDLEARASRGLGFMTEQLAVADVDLQELYNNIHAERRFENNKASDKDYEDMRRFRAGEQQRSDII